jgi:hypothetical protein
VEKKPETWEFEITGKVLRNGKEHFVSISGNNKIATDHRVDDGKAKRVLAGRLTSKAFADLLLGV